ncbi:hypothetical protein D4764_06G0009690, partial [Takifugu flavidus]
AALHASRFCRSGPPCSWCGHVAKAAPTCRWRTGTHLSSHLPLDDSGPADPAWMAVQWVGEGHPGVPPRRTSFPPPPHHHLHPLPGESFRLTGFPEQIRATPHALVRAPSGGGGGSSGEYCEPLMAAGAVGGASACALWVFLTLRSRRCVPPPTLRPASPLRRRDSRGAHLVMLTPVAESSWGAIGRVRRHRTPAG